MKILLVNNSCNFITKVAFAIIILFGGFKANAQCTISDAGPNKTFCTNSTKNYGAMYYRYDGIGVSSSWGSAANMGVVLSGDYTGGSGLFLQLHYSISEGGWQYNNGGGDVLIPFDAATYLDDGISIYLPSSMPVSDNDYIYVTNGITIGPAVSSSCESPYVYTWAPISGLSLSYNGVNIQADPTVTTTYTVTQSLSGTTLATKTVIVTVSDDCPVADAGPGGTIQTCFYHWNGVSYNIVPYDASYPYFDFFYREGIYHSPSAYGITVSGTLDASGIGSYVGIMYDLSSNAWYDITDVSLTTPISITYGASNPIGHGISVYFPPSFTPDDGDEFVITKFSGIGYVSLGGSPAVSGGTSPYTYAWTPTTGLTDPSSPNPDAYPTQTTTYTLTVTDADGIVTTSTTVVTVPTLIDASGPTTFCGGSPITLTANDGDSFLWSGPDGSGVTGSTDQSVIATVPGDYSVTITGGLDECLTSSTITIHPGTTAYAGANATVCCGGSVSCFYVNETTGSTYPVSDGSAHGLSVNGCPPGGSGSTVYILDSASPTGLDNASFTPVAVPSSINFPSDFFTNNASGTFDGDEIIYYYSSSGAQLGTNSSVSGSQPAASGGTAPYTYSWLPASGLSAYNIANPIATPTATTTYTLTVTDANGCTSSSTVVVTVDRPTAVAGNDAQFCSGSGSDSYTINATVTGSGSWQWQSASGFAGTFSDIGGATSLSLTVSLSSAVKQYRLRSASTCDGEYIYSNVVTVVVLAPITVDAGPDLEVCLGSCVIIGGSPTASGGVGHSTYSSSFFNSVSGTSDDGSTDGIVVSGLYTGGSSGSMDIIFIAGFGWTVDGITVLTTGAPVYLGAGIYVTIPSSLAPSDSYDGSDITINVDYTAPSYTYSWSPSTGINSTIANPSVCPTITTTYTIVVTDNNGCTGTDQVVVTVHAAPVANAGSDIAICAGSSTTIGTDPGASGGASPYTYVWSPTVALINPDASLAEVTPEVTTSYTLTVTDNNGCTGSDVVIVTVNPVPTAHAGRDTTICLGLSAPIGTDPGGSGGTSPYSYSWSPAATLSSSTSSVAIVSPTVTTTYTLMVTDHNGCTGIDVVIVTVNNCGCIPPQASFTIDPSTNNPLQFVNTSTSILSDVSYYWDFGDGTTSSDPNPSHAFGPGGNYKINLIALVVDSGHCCSDSASRKICCVPQPDFKCNTVTADFDYELDNTNAGTVNFTNTSIVTGDVEPLYKWDFGDNSSIVVTSSTSTLAHVYFSSGTYTVCEYPLDPVTKEECTPVCKLIGVSGFNQSQEMSFIAPDFMNITPNPTVEYVDIGYKNICSENAKIIVYDVLGREKFTYLIDPNNSSVRAIVQTWPPGFYTAKLFSDKQVLQAKSFSKVRN